MKTLYARLADEVHDTIADIAAIAGLSMAATIEAMVDTQAGRDHIYAHQYEAARNKYMEGKAGK